MRDKHLVLKANIGVRDVTWNISKIPTKIYEKDKLHKAFWYV